jgi:hypothetical protein
MFAAKTKAITQDLNVIKIRINEQAKNKNIKPA